MLTEKLIQVFFNLMGSLLGLLPTVEGSIPTEFLTTFSSVVLSASYFLPLKVLVQIFMLSVGLDVVNITWKTILRIKSFIPTMGT